MHSAVYLTCLSNKAQWDLCKHAWGMLDMIWSTSFQLTFKCSEASYGSIPAMITDYLICRRRYCQISPINLCG